MQPYRVRLSISLFFLVISAGPWSKQHLTAQKLDAALLNNLEYREIGPTRQSGRFVDIAVPNHRPLRLVPLGRLQGTQDTLDHGAGLPDWKTHHNQPLRLDLPARRIRTH